MPTPRPTDGGQDIGRVCVVDDATGAVIKGIDMAEADRIDQDTRPQTVRLRAASQQAKLNSERPTIANGRLQAAGTVDRLVRGVVRVQIEYVVAGKTICSSRRRSPTAAGR